MRPGDDLILRDGRVVRAQAVTIAPFAGDAYDFEVDDLNSDAVGPDGVLVHNQNTPGPGNAAPKGGPNVPFKTLQDQASGATAHIEISNGVAQIEIGYMQKVTKGFVDSLRNYAKQNGATSGILNPGPIINTDLAIKLGLLVSRGEKFFGGTVKLIQGGKTPIFEILFD